MHARAPWPSTSTANATASGARHRPRHGGVEDTPRRVAFGEIARRRYHSKSRTQLCGTPPRAKGIAMRSLHGMHTCEIFVMDAAASVAENDLSSRERQGWIRTSRSQRLSPALLSGLVRRGCAI